MTLHVIGAGVAGLSCALRAMDAGLDVVVHEAAGHAGGRCRSWHDTALECQVDNGTHMVVGANSAVFDYLARIGATNELAPLPTAFPMCDLDDGSRWTATPWVIAPAVAAAFFRLPGKPAAAIGQALAGSRHYRRFWEPLVLAIMNTPVADASSEVFRRVLALTLWRGLGASRPHLARHGLSATLVDPATRSLEQGGAQIRFHRPLRAIRRDGRRATALVFDGDEIAVGPADTVVLALPAAIAPALLDDLPKLPTSPIVNAHFRLRQPPELPRGFLGLVGGVGQWLFLRGDLLSVTVSAAQSIVERPAEDIADAIWAEAARALAINEPPRAWRVIKEKRATLLHRPDVEARRPACRFGDNLLLAGDWTATGLPCTLDGAIRSGVTAAAQAAGRRD